MVKKKKTKLKKLLFAFAFLCVTQMLINTNTNARSMYVDGKSTVLLGPGLVINHNTSISSMVDIFNSNGDAQVSGKTDDKNGIVWKKGKVYGYKNGKALTGFQKLKVKGKTKYYYFNDKGVAYKKGFKTIKVDGEKNSYFFLRNGAAYDKGLKKIKVSGKKVTCFFGTDGKAAKNCLKTVTVKGTDEVMYFDAEGFAVKDKWQTVDGKEFYFNKKGYAEAGKKTVGNYLVYYNADGSVRRKIDKTAKMVAVTYDDGPSKNTPTILDVLEQNGAVATFFVVGYQVETYASTIKRAYNMGCQIGNHSYNHKILSKNSASVISQEINDTNAVIKKVIGENPVIMRPPGGGVNDTVKATVKMPMICWSIDTRDWETRNASKTITAVLDHVQDGDIILMHDLYAQTAEASKTIIPGLIKKGYQLVTVSELADCKGYNLKDGTVYRMFR